MLTPQEVSEHAFAKAGFGGYNMAMVDEFLDQLTEDYTTLYKENAVLKSKMKVLVEKVEEYRSTEEAMRKTLLTAQKPDHGLWVTQTIVVHDKGHRTTACFDRLGVVEPLAAPYCDTLIGFEPFFRS